MVGCLLSFGSSDACSPETVIILTSILIIIPFPLITFPLNHSRGFWSLSFTPSHVTYVFFHSCALSSSKCFHKLVGVDFLSWPQSVLSVWLVCVCPYFRCSLLDFFKASILTRTSLFIYLIAWLGESDSVVSETKHIIFYCERQWSTLS